MVVFVFHVASMAFSSSASSSSVASSSELSFSVSMSLSFSSLSCIDLFAFSNNNSIKCSSEVSFLMSLTFVLNHFSVLVNKSDSSVTGSFGYTKSILSIVINPNAALKMLTNIVLHCITVASSIFAKWSTILVANFLYDLTGTGKSP